MLIDWYLVTLEQLQELWQGFLLFLPKLIGSLIILLIGWFISVGIGKIIAEVLKRIKFNQVFERGVWKKALEKAEFKIDPAGFIGAIVKWILMIVFLLAAVEILGFVKFADFLNDVLNYLPNVIVASLIFAVAVILADMVEKVVRVALEGVGVSYSQIAGAIVRWSIWIFAVSAILIQLNVAADLIRILFVGFVGIIVLAGGIAFGLGGKEIAGEFLKELKRKLEDRENRD